MNREEFIRQVYLSPDDSYILTEEEREGIMTNSLAACTPTMKYIVTMEELAELQKEISKKARRGGNNSDLLQELADVYICLEYVRALTGITEEEVYRAIDVKLIQERERMRST